MLPMKALFRPLAMALAVGLGTALALWLIGKLINVPGWLTILATALSTIITGTTNAMQNMTLKSYLRAIAAFFTNAPFLYELDIRIDADTALNISDLAALVEERYASRATLGVRGDNYLHVRFTEPPRTAEIKVQPDAGKLAYFEDGFDFEEQAEARTQAYVVTIDLVDPVELRFRDSESKKVRDTFDVLHELAAEITRMLDSQRPYYTITINRVKEGVRPKHPHGPGPGSVTQVLNDVRISRDGKALQLQSNSPASIVKHLTENIGDLDPV